MVFFVILSFFFILFIYKKPEDFKLRPGDRWIISKCNNLVKEVTENMDKFELGIALSKIYDFLWDEFCDWYIELAKYRIYHADEDAESANDALWTLREVLKDSLKLLHPYMPFVTEEIYSNSSKCSSQRRLSREG